MEQWLQYLLLVGLFCTVWKVEEIHRQLRRIANTAQVISNAAQVIANAAQVIEQRVEDKEFDKELKELREEEEYGGD